MIAALGDAARVHYAYPLLGSTNKMNPWRAYLLGEPGKAGQCDPGKRLLFANVKGYKLETDREGPRLQDVAGTTGVDYKISAVENAKGPLRADGSGGKIY
jgi:hypothetical protein